MKEKIERLIENYEIYEKVIRTNMRLYKERDEIEDYKEARGYTTAIEDFINDLKDILKEEK